LGDTLIINKSRKSSY